MSNDKGDKKKRCPFLNEPCIGSECAIQMEVVQQKVVLGIPTAVKKSVCSFEALAMIMSSKPVAQQQAIPPVFGRG